MPLWTAAEFDTLLNNPTLTDQQLAHMLPGRSADAITVVRAGVCAYHRNLNTSMLSQVMLQRLAQSGGLVTCPRDGTRF